MSAAPAPSAPVTSVPSEDVIARKFDNCVRTYEIPHVVGGYALPRAADFIVNAGIGFGVGVVASVILFRRRGWPVALSTGFGAGVAYSNCNHSLNPYVLPGTKVLKQ